MRRGLSWTVAKTRVTPQLGAGVTSWFLHSGLVVDANCQLAPQLRLNRASAQALPMAWSSSQCGHLKAVRRLPWGSQDECPRAQGGAASPLLTEP